MGTPALQASLRFFSDSGATLEKANHQEEDGEPAVDPPSGDHATDRSG
jgi:hypothetical protein